LPRRSSIALLPPLESGNEIPDSFPVPDPTHTTQIDEDCNAWFVAWGKRPVARTSFGRELAGLGFPKHRSSAENGRVVYRNIRIKSQTPTDYHKSEKGQ